MPVDPQLQPVIDALYQSGAIPYELHGVATARLGYDTLGSLGEIPEGVEVGDITVGGAEGDLVARLYRPAGASGAALLYFHGGGFVIGSPTSHHVTTAILAAESRATVISVDYRLAPEHPYPAAVEDAVAATAWVAEHAAELGIDETRLAVGGDSAGGCLATVVARRARDAGGPTLAAQLLIYPAADMQCARPSMTGGNAEGYVLERGTMEWFRANYLPDERTWTHPDVSPLYAQDLRGLPPAVVATCEFDPLRDQGDEYAWRLAEAGVEVWHRCYQGLVHTFVQFTPLSDLARAATDEIARAIGTFLDR